MRTDICNRPHALENTIFCTIIRIASLATLFMFSHISSGKARPNRIVERQIQNLLRLRVNFMPSFLNGQGNYGPWSLRTVVALCIENIYFHRLHNKI